MAWEDVENVGSHVEEDVGGGCFSSICSFNFFMHVSYDFLLYSTFLGSFVTFCDVLSMFILRYKEKNVETNMDPIFERPIFDSAREKMKRFIRHLEKSEKVLEKLLHTCFKCESNNVFSVAKQVRSADEGTSVFNEC